MSITIRDVAKKLNLSITTVSRALDGYEDVSEETRQLVVQTAHQMGYVPNQAARQLRRKRSDTIGYLLPAQTPRFSEPFFAEFIAGLGDEASANGFDLLVSTAPAGSQTERMMYERWIHSRKVDGIILNRMHLFDWRVQFLSEAKFPFVSMERSSDPVEYSCVEVNGRTWFKILVDHLIALGHRRIAYIGATPELKIQVDRMLGYQDSLQEHGLIIDPALLTIGDLTSEGGYQASQILFNLTPAPTAIACIDDMTAIGVLHAARERGFNVGKDLAVAGFDGIEGFEHTQPPLTTINQPVYSIARQLVQMLADQISGKSIHSRCIQVQPTLEIRQSTSGR